MFKDSKAFSSFAINDVPAAKAFYEQVLGLPVAEEMGGLSLRLAGCNPLFLYPKQNHKPAAFTVLNFSVDNVEHTVDTLTGRGVRFEQYDDVGGVTTDAKGIFRYENIRQAWFKDPAGNILSIIEDGN